MSCAYRMSRAYRLRLVFFGCHSSSREFPTRIFFWLPRLANSASPFHFPRQFFLRPVFVSSIATSSPNIRFSLLRRAGFALSSAPRVAVAVSPSPGPAVPATPPPRSPLRPPLLSAPCPPHGPCPPDGYSKGFRASVHAWLPRLSARRRPVAPTSSKRHSPFLPMVRTRDWIRGSIEAPVQKCAPCDSLRRDKRQCEGLEASWLESRKGQRQRSPRFAMPACPRDAKLQAIWRASAFALRLAAAFRCRTQLDEFGGCTAAGTWTFGSSASGTWACERTAQSAPCRLHRLHSICAFCSPVALHHGKCPERLSRDYEGALEKWGLSIDAVRGWDLATQKKVPSHCSLRTGQGTSIRAGPPGRQARPCRRTTGVGLQEPCPRES